MKRFAKYAALATTYFLPIMAHAQSIGQLPAASSVSTADQMAILQSGSTKRATAAQITNGALGVTPGAFGLNLLASSNQFAGQTLLGLGSAAYQPATAFDVSGAAAAAQAASLQKSNNLSDLASAAAARINLGLGSAATQATTAFDAAGAASTAQVAAETFASNSSNQAIGTLPSGRLSGGYLGITNLGTISMGGPLTLFADATQPLQPVSLEQLNSLVVNKYNASAVANSNVSLTSAPATIDGYTLTASQCVLFTNQTSSVNNGLWVYPGSGSAFTIRCSGATVYSGLYGSAVLILNGTAFTGTTWSSTSPASGTIGTTPITFVQTGLPGGVTAGVGITVSGNSVALSNTGVTAGTYGSATQAAAPTVNAQGQITGIATYTVTPAIGSITGLGSGVATAAANATNSAGGIATSGGPFSIAGATGLTSSQVTAALGYTPPTPTGAGAGGTWGISIAGNAATASTAPLSGITGLATGVAAALAVAPNTNGGFAGSYMPTFSGTSLFTGLINDSYGQFQLGSSQHLIYDGGTQNGYGVLGFETKASGTGNIFFGMSENSQGAIFYAPGGTLGLGISQSGTDPILISSSGVAISTPTTMANTLTLNSASPLQFTGTGAAGTATIQGYGGDTVETITRNGTNNYNSSWYGSGLFSGNLNSNSNIAANGGSISSINSAGSAYFYAIGASGSTSGFELCNYSGNCRWTMGLDASGNYNIYAFSAAGAYLGDWLSINNATGAVTIPTLATSSETIGLTGYLYGNGSSPITASAAIPGSAVSGNIPGLSAGAPISGITGLGSGVGSALTNPINSSLGVLTQAGAPTALGLQSAAYQPATAFDTSGAAATAQAASLQKANNLSDLASAATARTNLGLGTAATQATTAFDPAGAASTAQTTAETFASNSSNQTTGTLPNARLSGVPNSALANSALTIAGHYISLGGTQNLQASDLTGLGANVAAALNVAVNTSGGLATSADAVFTGIGGSSSNSIVTITGTSGAGGFSINDNSTSTRGYYMHGAHTYGIDLTQDSTTNGLLLSSGQSICFNGVTDCVSWNGSAINFGGPIAVGSATLATTATTAPNTITVACDITGATDCSSLVQSAISTLEAAQGGTVQLPGGLINLTAGVVLGQGGVTLQGRGWQEWAGSSSATTNDSTLGTLGTYITTTSTSTSPITLGHANWYGSAGQQPVVRDMAFTQPQPADASGWTPTVYPPSIQSYANSGLVENVMCYGVYLCAQNGTAAALSSRLTIRHIYGFCWDACIYIAGAVDTNTVEDTHFWSAFVGNANPNKLSYMQANSYGILSERDDNPIFSDVFVYGMKAAILFGSNSAGVTSRFHISNLDADGDVYGLLITGSGTYGEVSNLTWQSDWNGSTGIGGSSGVYVQSTASNVQVFFTNSFLSHANTSCIDNESTSSILSFTNTDCNGYNFANSGLPAVRNVNNGIINLSGSFTAENGGGGGIVSGGVPFSTLGVINLALSSGATPALSGTCTTSALVGSATTGKFNATCSVQTVILTFGLPAPNGYACAANDNSTLADSLKPTTYTTTSCTLQGTTGSADLITYKAYPF